MISLFSWLESITIIINVLKTVPDLASGKPLQAVFCVPLTCFYHS